MLTIFTSKLGITISLLSFIFIVTDVNQRFANNHVTKMRDEVAYSTGEITSPQLTHHNAKKLETFINKYQTTVVATPKQAIGMSDKDQNKQNGLLNTLYIDDNKLQLKAVIQTNKENQHQLQTLLLITNVINGEQNIEKFSNHASVYGYQLTIEKNTQVSLVRNAQTIILTMYTGKGLGKY